MNTKLAKRLMEALRTPQPEQPEFNMKSWFQDDSHGKSCFWATIHPGCGTTCCAAGTVAWLRDAPIGCNIEIFAQDALELTDDEADWFFYGKFSSRPLQDITAEETIGAIEWLLEEREVRIWGGDGGGFGWVKLS